MFTDGTGAVLAQGAATACGNCEIGLTVTFSSQGGNYGIGFGPHSGECLPGTPSQSDRQHAMPSVACDGRQPPAYQALMGGWLPAFRADSLHVTEIDTLAQVE